MVEPWLLLWQGLGVRKPKLNLRLLASTPRLATSVASGEVRSCSASGAKGR